jgi:lipopolysaccharide transport system permease protein
MLFVLLRSIYRNREFVLAMAVREIRGLNKGALLGIAWLIVNPFIKVATYVVIVSYVFAQRLGPDSGPFDYALYVLSGMVPWQLMTRVLEDSPGLVRDRQDLVKQVIYPIETLPVSGLLMGVISAGVNLAVLFALSVVAGRVGISWLLLPLPVLLLFAMLIGTAWIFSIVGVVLKDLREIVSVLLGLLVFISPVVLSPSIVGDQIWRLILINPLAHVVLCFRDVFDGTFTPLSWAIFASMSVLLLGAGAYVMGRAKTMVNEYI